MLTFNLKKLLLPLSSLLILSLQTFASDERLFVSEGGNGTGYENPCAKLTLKVTYTPPAGYNATTFDWYYNDIYSFSTGYDNIPLSVENSKVTVKCIVHYERYADNQLSTSTGTSNTLTINSKTLSIATTQSGVATIGCPGQITLSTAPVTPDDPAKQFKPGNDYTVTWSLPSGWVVNSATEGNRSITFTPDATTTGNVTAIYQYWCGFSNSPKTIAIQRPLPPITFAEGGTLFCAPASYNYSIEPVCGATNYTYSISGNTNCVFTASGTQSYTTSSTSVNISIPDADRPYDVVLTATANFDGGQTSSGNKNIHFGVPSPSAIEGMPNTIDPSTYFQANGGVSLRMAESSPSYLWTVWGGSIVSGQYSAAISVRLDGCAPNQHANNYFYVEAQLENACGFGIIGKGNYVICNSNEPPPDQEILNVIAYPNPASDYLNISLQENSTATSDKQTKNESGKISFVLYNVNSTRVVRAWQQEAGKKVYNLSLAGIPKGQYVIQLIKGKQKITKNIVLLK